MLDDAFSYEERPLRWSDRRVGLMLGALVCVVLALVGAMLVVVLLHAWPSFSHNGLGWFGAGGNVDQQIQAIFNSGEGAPTTSTTSTPGR